MIAALAERWADLSARERALVLILLLAGLPLAIFQLVALPIWHARTDAEARHREAVALYHWVSERDAAWRVQTGSGGAQAGAIAPVGLAGIEAELTGAGLHDAVMHLEALDGGRVLLRLGAVAFTDLGRFLETLDLRSGYAIASLRIKPGAAPGLVEADLGLVPQRGG